MKREKAFPERIHRRKSVAREIAYIGVAVALITVCAWISVPVFSIPFTLQTFAVALVGGLLGWKRGTAAILVYILMGLIGIPVFSGFKAGVPALFGATGGYIFGFLFLCLLPALAKLIPAYNGAARTMVFYCFSILGCAVLYFFGTVWLILMTRCAVGYALGVCVVPFIIPDAVKLALSALVTVRLDRHITYSI